MNVLYEQLIACRSQGPETEKGQGWTILEEEKEAVVVVVENQILYLSHYFTSVFGPKLKQATWVPGR